jgi:hypothetical protein
MPDNLTYPRSLIAIGYWQSGEIPTLPHPKDFVNDQIKPGERKLLIEYLDKGKQVIAYLGYSYCRFNCGTPDHEMGNSCLTDGKYIWPEKLSHYIRKHDVWLPAPFILRVKDNQNYSPLDIDLKKELDPYNQINHRKYRVHDYEWWGTCKNIK